MGFKKRKKRLKGTLQLAVMRALSGRELSKKQLTARLKRSEVEGASTRSVASAVKRLLKDGWIAMEGHRAAARFRSAD